MSNAEVKVLVLYYSMYGHIHKMAQAIAEGARKVPGVTVDLRRVPETLSPAVLEKMGATAAKEQMDKEVSVLPIEEIQTLANYDAIIFDMTAQMKAFLDATGGMWAKGAFVGKVASVFTSSNTQHGGQESTILSFHIVLLHQGFLVVGLPYAYPGLMNQESISGCSPYGASTIAGRNGEKTPNQVELDGARFQGEHVAKITRDLVVGRNAAKK